MNNTADLYTGANSGSFNNARTEQRATIVDTKKKQRSQLVPAYELVAEFIAIEKAKVANIEYLFVDGYVPDKELNAELIARRRYLAYLNGLDAKLASLLRGEK